MAALSAAAPAKYAGLGQRFGALVVDFFVLSLVFFPVTRLVKGNWVMTGGDHMWSYGWLITDPLCLISLAIILGYFVVLEGVLGATLGKRVLGLRVVAVDGHRPGASGAA